MNLQQTSAHKVHNLTFVSVPVFFFSLPLNNLIGPLLLSSGFDQFCFFSHSCGNEGNVMNDSFYCVRKKKKYPIYSRVAIFSHTFAFFLSPSRLPRSVCFCKNTSVSLGNLWRLLTPCIMLLQNIEYTSLVH